MKRSEMVDFIHWYLNDQLVVDPHRNRLLKESADDILAHLEDKGMDYLDVSTHTIGWEPEEGEDD